MKRRVDSKAFTESSGRWKGAMDDELNMGSECQWHLPITEEQYVNTG